jgi:predicted AAA+ superfamily ATPase
LRQDLLSLDQVKDLESLELLIEMLARRVGSTVSFNSLAQDLDCDDKTVKRWIGILEDLYIIFRVTPFSKNIARALKKAAKFYFYDCARVEGDESQKLENLVALGLRKELDFLEDSEGMRSSLNFIRTREDKEIDFVIQSPHFKTHLIEVKLSDASVSTSFRLTEKGFPHARRLQLVKNLDREYDSKTGAIRVCSVLGFLEAISFQ